MPLKDYGVLKGRPISRRLAVQANPHYQIRLVDDTTDYRIAINVKSKLAPSEVEYALNSRFIHPITARLLELPLGYTPIPSQPGGLALDYVRGNLFERSQLVPLPFDAPGAQNDLNEIVDVYVQQALGDEDALIYAFGERWGPEPQKKDKIFGFLPGNGIHDIHMNQGNAASFREQDGVWQDGAMFIHFPTTDQWVALFLKFQSQAWQTDNTTGHRLEVVGVRPEVENPYFPGEPTGVVRIVGALVNPVGPAPEPESVLLLNTSPQTIDLTGWSLADRHMHKQTLTGSVPAGGILTVPVSQGVQLGNQGGTITLFNGQDLKVHGVAYTREQAQPEGWTIVF